MNRVKKETLLRLLPEFRDEWIVVNPGEQSVGDIIEEVLKAHGEFAADYDLIAPVFDDGGSIEEIASSLYFFCKDNIRYQEEGDEWQTTALPAGILARGYGDCKHYASFIGGVLDALNRRGRRIDWVYRFASYRLTDSTPHHVFIVIRRKEGELWIDPTPGAAGTVPIWQVDKKVKSMAVLRNIAGVVGDTDTSIEDPVTETAIVVPDVNAITQTDLVNALEEIDTTVDLSTEDFNAIAILLNNQVINEEGSVDNGRLDMLLNSLQDPDKQILTDAYNRYMAYSQNVVGNLFGDLWKGVKTVTLALPRNAFLGLVSLNVFGYASKMNRLLSIPDAKQKLIDKWKSLGGRESNILTAITTGARKKAILGAIGSRSIGVAPAAAAPAWLAVAGGIIAAIMPLVTSLLKSHNAYTPDFQALDNNQYYNTSGSNFFDSIKNFIAQNPIPSAAAAIGIFYLVWKD